MLPFVTESLWTISGLVAFGAIGAFAVIPFRSQVSYPLLMAPIAGVLIVGLGAAVLYCLVAVSFPMALLATVCSALATSAISAWLLPLRPANSGALATQLTAGVLLAVVMSLLVSTSSIRYGSPGTLFVHGTDHAAYSHVADWIRVHTPLDRPRADPSVPYESLPAFIFQVDTRFGAFSVLAATATGRNLSGFLAYDAVNTIALTAGILGVAAVFARTPGTLAIAIVGLASSTWLVYAHRGFLGRVIAYPSSMFVLGLLLTAPSMLPVTGIGALVALAVGAATMHHGVSVGTLMFFPGAAFVLFRLLLELNRGLGISAAISEMWPRCVALILMCGAAALVPAGTGRPISPIRWDAGVTWGDIAGTMADLETQGLFPFVFGPEALLLAIGASLVISAIVLGLGWTHRNATAAGLILGCMAILATLLVQDSPTSRWAASNLAGTFYPLALCGGVALLAGQDSAGTYVVKPKLLTTIVMGALLFVFVGLRQPHFLTVVREYVVAENPWYRFTQDEMDALQRAIGQEAVEIDMGNHQLALAAFVELGVRGVEMRYSERGWKTSLGFRDWLLPSMPPAPLVLRDKTEPSAESGVAPVFYTRQYLLGRRV
jgi:hypothetical protein